jgi:hypothetical protein
MVVVMCVGDEVGVMVGKIGYLTRCVNGIIYKTDRTTPLATHKNSKAIVDVPVTVA